MSTRATYLLAASGWPNHEVCMYIHHDGHLEGAAKYFWKMHLYKNDRGWFAGRFFCANDNAEFTYAHDTYNDTQYRYTLKANGHLTAWHTEGCGKKWQVVYEGTWYEFVNRYFQSAEKLYCFKTLLCQKDGIVMTINEVKELIEIKIKHIEKALSEEPIRNANFTEREVTYLQGQLDQILMNNNH